MKAVVILVGLTLMLEYSEAKKIKIGECKPLPEPLFGSIKVKSSTEVKYLCNKGFRLVGGRATRFCLKKRGLNYFYWSGRTRSCRSADRLGARKCPRIYNPTNGAVGVLGYSRGDIATFSCNTGHVLVGDHTLTCGAGYRWNKAYPTCQGRKGVVDFANTLKDKFIDEYATTSVDSKDGIQAKLSPGKSGLDLVFAIDTSASIGQTSLEKGKQFIEVICKKFGISNDTTGGKSGTRIALITFSDKANIVFNLGDKDVRDMDSVIEKIKGIKTEGGGTNFFNLLEKIKSKIYITNFGNRKAKRDKQVQERRDNANRAIFIITDAEKTFEADEDQKAAKQRFTSIAKIVRNVNRFEVFAIGVGTKIQKTVLAEIASAPFYEHVFEIKNFDDLKTIGDIIAEENIDYGKCGISGNTERNQDGNANKGAWPWLGWVAVLQNSGSMITCGGALLCDKWFVTLANCVSEKTNEGITTLEQMINVYLGDQDNLMLDPTEMMVAVKQIHVHPNYTGVKNQHGVMPFDVALLELGEDNTTIPKLNKFIRPICFLESRDKPNYDRGLSMLGLFKSQNQKLKAQIAGWGHMGNQKIYTPEVYPWQNLKQVDRSLQTDLNCDRKYPDLDTSRYICVGQIHEPDLETCYGDVGGPLMALMGNKRYTFLGLALKTKDCTELYEFSLFLNILHPDINVWIQKQLRGCNRINEPIPYVDDVEEEPVDAGNNAKSEIENREDIDDAQNQDNGHGDDNAGAENEEGGEENVDKDDQGNANGDSDAGKEEGGEENVDKDDQGNADDDSDAGKEEGGEKNVDNGGQVNADVNSNEEEDDNGGNDDSVDYLGLNDIY